MKEVSLIFIEFSAYCKDSIAKALSFQHFAKQTQQKCCVFDTWSADVSVFTRVIF